MSVHLHIDPFSGIAGDMFIGAMIDLGVDLEKLRALLAPLPIGSDYALSADPVLRRGIAAVDFKVAVPQAPIGRRLLQGGAVPTSHAHRGDILAMIDRLEISERGKARARAIVDALACAEAQVHRTSIEEVHFHEVGAVDSIVDMLGAAVAMELLGVDTVSCGPLPISRGFVRCDHGRMPVPAPATAYILRGMATVGVDRNSELVTPTGAAIVAGLAASFAPSPLMTLTAVGHGAGDRDDPEVPNVLRLFLGTLRPPPPNADPAPPAAFNRPRPAKSVSSPP